MLPAVGENVKNSDRPISSGITCARMWRPMKIVFLAPFGIRPKGTLKARMLPLAAELQSLGHEVVIVAPPYTNREDSGREETVNGVRLRNIAVGPDTRAVDAPVIGLRMYLAMRQEHPDIVHLFKPKGYGGLTAMLLHFLGRLGIDTPPFFVDTDDLEGRGGMNDVRGYNRAERLVFGFQERWLPVRAAGVTVASRALEKFIHGMGVSPAKVLYLPNGSSSLPGGEGLPVRRRFGMTPDTPVVLLYTRFFEFSQARLHALFAEIHVRIPEVRFLIVGQGRNQEEGSLLEAARQGGFADSLAMAGWVDPLELPAYMAAADVAVYPFDDTLLNRAKCPAKLVELMSAGIAVVADRVGQVSEYIQSGNSGILTDPHDHQSMAHQVVSLLLDAPGRTALGDGARRRIRECFSWQGLARSLDTFYSSHQGFRAVKEENPHD